MTGGRWHFDKPVVQAEDFFEIACLFVPESTVLDMKHLGGVPNITFSVESTNGNFAIRVCNNGYTSIEHLNLELSTLRHLERVGFRWSPRLVSDRNGHFVRTWRGYRVIATQQIEGRPADEVDVTLDHCRQIGSAIALLRRALDELPSITSDSESYWRRSERLLDSWSARELERELLVDPNRLRSNWDQLSSSIMSDRKADVLIHTDIWPPNVLISGARVTGIVDFDDMAIGPAIIDIAAAVSEFSVSPRGDLLSAQAESLLRGYVEGGGSLRSEDCERLVDAIQLCYISWLACNVLHGVPFMESAIYVDRLSRLEDPRFRNEFVAKVEVLLSSSDLPDSRASN